MSDILLRNVGYSGGAGSELSALYASFGIRQQPGCTCRKMAELMDLNGIGWCEANIDRIVEAVQQEGARRGIGLLAAIGARPTVHLAISRAKAKGGCRP